MADSTNPVVILDALASDLLKAAPPATFVSESGYTSPMSAKVLSSIEIQTVTQEVIVYTAPPPSNEDPGDYVTQVILDADVDPALDRHTAYMVGSNVRTVLKELRLVNTANASRTLTIWLAGIPYVYSLAAAGSAGDKLTESCWTILYAADLIEVESSAVGVALIVSAVENVVAE